MEFKIEKIIVDYLKSEEENLLDLGSEDSDFLKCESPIEQLMLLALQRFFENFDWFFDRYVFDIQVQSPIEHSKYRTDIALRFSDMKKEINLLYAIECDGHEFHEKTKEQIRRDRSRERFLMQQGYKVIRFSGSEIVDSPSECAFEVWQIVKGDLKRNE